MSESAEMKMETEMVNRLHFALELCFILGLQCCFHHTQFYNLHLFPSVKLNVAIRVKQSVLFYDFLPIFHFAMIKQQILYLFELC